MHCLAPAFSLYLPATHDLQPLKEDPENPGLHLQLFLDEVPAIALEFGGQSVQTPGPVVGLYLPASHAVQFAHTVGEP